MRGPTPLLYSVEVLLLGQGNQFLVSQNLLQLCTCNGFRDELLHPRLPRLLLEDLLREGRQTHDVWKLDRQLSFLFFLHPFKELANFDSRLRAIQLGHAVVE